MHALQNTLAHQRLSQSRTSLDDSEYTTRFNRLDGLISQLAFSIRKSWKTIPAWLQPACNKDAIATGKQEMTAVGRAFISAWLVEELFNRCFHPDLEPELSSQLKLVQLNIRKFAPAFQSGEEEDALIAKIINWRLTTVEGLQELLRAPQASEHRQKLVAQLDEKLVASLSSHLQDPAPPDLNGGVSMIIELATGIAAHLPLESRDVHIEYFPPGHAVVADVMKLESGAIAALTNPMADPALDAADHASLRSFASDIKDSATTSSGEELAAAAAAAAGKEQQALQQQQQQQLQQEAKSGRRGMFGGLMGGKKTSGSPASQQQQQQQQQLVQAQAQKQVGAGGSQMSLTQQLPGSAAGPKEEPDRKSVV